jgi:Zn-dependent peptidase ImmA (M78 family)/transcriptional regulator with XRE-family HTH domain
MNSDELGKKIQLLRKKRGLTQEAVEKTLEFPQKAMSRIEAGLRFPTTLELAKLAQLFQISVGDFFQDEEIQENPLVAFYRLAQGLEIDSSIRQEVDLCVQLCKEGASLENTLGYHQRQRVALYQVENPKTKSMAICQGEQIAKEERKRLNRGNLPIQDIEGLLSTQGIWCADTLLPKQMSGLFLHSPSIGGMVILVNSSHVLARKRFSYAHEYAHALFDASQHILISDSSNSSEFIEIRANAFAAAFLMPGDGVLEVLYSIHKGHASRLTASIFDVSTQGVIEAEERKIAKNQKLTPQDVALIAYRFGVSYQAAAHRLLSLGHVSKEEREKLLEQESSGKEYLALLYLDHFEKIERQSPLQRELRTHISHLVIEAYRQGKISRGRVIEFSKLLKLPAKELLDLASIDYE